MKLCQLDHLTLIYAIQTLQAFIVNARKNEKEIIRSKQEMTGSAPKEDGGPVADELLSKQEEYVEKCSFRSKRNEV